MVLRLLDVLAQRKDPRGLKNGVVLLNGERPPADFRLMSGYVVQVRNNNGNNSFYNFLECNHFE